MDIETKMEPTLGHSNTHGSNNKKLIKKIGALSVFIFIFLSDEMNVDVYTHLYHRIPGAFIEL